jgi:hypothetical protein
MPGGEPLCKVVVLSVCSRRLPGTVPGISIAQRVSFGLFDEIKELNIILL